MNSLTSLPDPTAQFKLLLSHKLAWSNLRITRSRSSLSVFLSLVKISHLYTYLVEAITLSRDAVTTPVGFSKLIYLEQGLLIPGVTAITIPTILWNPLQPQVVARGVGLLHHQWVPSVTICWWLRWIWCPTVQGPALKRRLNCHLTIRSFASLVSSVLCLLQFVQAKLQVDVQILLRRSSPSMVGTNYKVDTSPSVSAVSPFGSLGSWGSSSSRFGLSILTSKEINRCHESTSVSLGFTHLRKVCVNMWE